MADNEQHFLIGGNTRDLGGGKDTAGGPVFYGGQRAAVDPAMAAAHIALRPIEYAAYGQVLGHYRAVALSGAVVSVAGNGIVNSMWWTDALRYFVLLRLSLQAEVIGAVTTAAPIDMKAYVVRGITSAGGTGNSATTLTLTGDNQKCRKSMGTSLLASSPQGAGEIRTAGTAVFAAMGGKTNDADPFGYAFLHAGLVSTTGTGVAVKVWPGSTIPSIQDLFIAGPYNHPIVLAQNEGIECQLITAGNASGSFKYAWTYEWAEVVVF